MTILVSCPNDSCGAEYRFKDDKAGKKGSCKYCGVIFTVPYPDPEPIETSDIVVDLSDLDDASDQQPLVNEWEPHPDYEAPDIEDPIPLPAPVGGTTTSSGTGPSGTVPINELALNPHLMLFTIQVGLGWGVGMALMAVLMIGLELPLLAAIGAGALCGAIPTLLTAGISCLTATALEQPARLNWRLGWQRFFERFVSLFLGVFCVTMLFGIVVGLGGVAVFGLTLVPSVGSYIGGLLVIPTFLAVLFVFAILLAMPLLPVIISVENCGAFDAFDRLRKLLHRDKFGLPARVIGSLILDLPFMLFTAVIAVTALGVSLMLCGGGVLMSMNPLADDPGGSVLLHVISTMIIFGCWLAFVLVRQAVCFTCVYLESRSA